VLTDEATRRAYDNVLKARKAHELRVRAMDGKRQKLKAKLDRGERQHEDELWNRAEDENALAREIARLRAEGSRQLEEEQELLRKQLAEEILGRGRQAEEREQARVKVRWDRKSTAWPYDRDSLERIFSKYGDVAAIVVNTKKGGSALVEFTSLNDARMAANIETGLPVWISCTIHCMCSCRPAPRVTRCR
jgi:DnaJ family protein C protein 17